MKLNRNAWLNRILLRTLFLMPVSLNNDMEVEFEAITGDQITDVLEYWKLNRDIGIITEEQHYAIRKIIMIGFERRAAELGLLNL